MATGVNQVDTLRHKVIRRFYEPLLLLDALDPVRGERIKSEIIPDGTGTNHTQTRRNFTDAVAYICAYKKEPEYVTAAALEKTPQGVVVWLAANHDVEDKVIEFLKAILVQVQKVVNQDDVDNRQRVALLTIENLSSEITTFQTPRLEIYRSQIKNIIGPCLEVLADYSKKSRAPMKDKDALLVNDIQNWLKKYFNDEDKSCARPTIFEIVNACYEIRHTQTFRTLALFAAPGGTRFQQFERLYKLLAKLGKPLMASKVLAEGATKLWQDLAQGLTVQAVPSSKFMTLPFRKKEGTIQSIVGRMFTKKREQDDFMNRLNYLQREDIEQYLLRERFKKTRVHAELLLIDHFERTKGDFLDGHEKYIGCSKPACYLCHMYIAQHPGHYVVPRGHNKLYLAWRPPGIFSGDTCSALPADTHEKIMLKMIETVRKDLVAEISSRNIRRPIHADSTAGITSTLASMTVDGNSLLQIINSENQGYSSAKASYASQVDELDGLEESDSEGGVPI